MTEFFVIYERADDGSWHASAADLPVFAVGDSREDATRAIRDAIAFHLKGLREAGEEPPSTASVIGTVRV